jgi:hypothetical protein
MLRIMYGRIVTAVTAVFMRSYRIDWKVANRCNVAVKQRLEILKDDVSRKDEERVARSEAEHLDGAFCIAA